MEITRRSQIPGSRFKPKQLELVNHYLRRKIEEGKSYSFIPEMDMYEKEPWLLQHVRHVRSKNNVWFYFVTRKLAGNKKRNNSTRINRKVGGGRWKTNGILKTVEDDNGVKVGSKQLITFNIKTNIEAARDKATGWVMHEYLLNKPGFQELALCKIKFKQCNDDTRFAPRLESLLVGLPQPQPQLQPQPQHQDFGSYGQLVGAYQQNDVLEQVMVPQAMNAHYGSYSAQLYDPPQFSMEIQQLCDPQYQQWNGSYSAQLYDPLQAPQATWEQQWNGPYSAQPYDPSQAPQATWEQQWNGPYSAQPYDPSQAPQATWEQPWNGPYTAQQYDPSQVSMEMQQQNQLIEQANHQFSEFSGPYLAQPHDQNHHNVVGIEKNEEDWNNLLSSINFDGLLEDTDFPDFPEFSTEQQEEDQIIEKDTHLPYMMNLEERQYVNPYHQHFGQNYDLSLMVPLETQNQDNVIGNLTQPCEQGSIAGSSSTHNQLIQQPLGLEAAMSGHDMVW